MYVIYNNSKLDMKVTFKIEKNYHSDKKLAYYLFELIPGIAIRYIRGEFGREENMYVSWLLWTVSVTISNKNKR